MDDPKKDIWAEYERRKRELWDSCDSVEQFEIEVRKLIEELKV